MGILCSSWAASNGCDTPMPPNRRTRYTWLLPLRPMFGLFVQLEATRHGRAHLCCSITGDPIQFRHFSFAAHGIRSLRSLAPPSRVPVRLSPIRNTSSAGPRPEDEASPTVWPLIRPLYPLRQWRIRPARAREARRPLIVRARGSSWRSSNTASCSACSKKVLLVCLRSQLPLL